MVVLRSGKILRESSSSCGPPPPPIPKSKRSSTTTTTTTTKSGGPNPNGCWSDVQGQSKHMSSRHSLAFGFKWGETTLHPPHDPSPLKLPKKAYNRTSVQPQIPNKKVASEIPTPEFVIVGTYERDYSRTFNQPTSYLRARGARAEIGEFVEYDLDNEDEDWLQDYNKDTKTLEAEKLEMILFKLEVLDHKARERAGVITPTLSAPIQVLLTFDAAVEALQALSINFGVFRSIYNYWKEKRDRWQKPILRRLQPPPPVNDTNPYNVFRPREKAHRLQTRRMQRRENNVQSFEKLRQREKKRFLERES